MKKDDMRILHVIAPGPVAGAEKSALSSVQALRSAGYDVSFAVIKETRTPSCADDFVGLAHECGISSTVFLTGKRFDTSLAQKLRTHIRAHDINIVHSHNYKALVHVSMFRPEVPVLIATYHGATSHTLSVYLYECLDWLLYQKIDCLFAVSESAQNRLEQRGQMKCRVAIVPNMVSQPLIKKPHRDVSEKTSFSLLFLGRLSYEKGADVLIEAMSLLESPNIELHIVGDGPERSHLEQAAHASGVENNIVFHGFQRDVVSHLNRADILMMPSRTEGLPMALIEAACTGVPVIASRVGGIPEVVTHDDNALLVNPDNPGELKQAISKMTADFSRFYSSGLAYAEPIAKRYSAERWVSAAVSEYQRALAESPAFRRRSSNHGK